MGLCERNYCLALCNKNAQRISKDYNGVICSRLLKNYQYSGYAMIINATVETINKIKILCIVNFFKLTNKNKDCDGAPVVNPFFNFSC
jgi:hypothetical protein